MAKKKPLVVVTRRLPESIETRMRELFDARLNAYHAAEVVKIACLGQREGGKAEGGNQEFGLEFHVIYLVLGGAKSGLIV